MSRCLAWIGQWLASSRSRLFRSVAARHLAVLIDGDGVSAKDANKVLTRLAPLGRIGILRVYGNFSGRNAASWATVLRRYGAIARHMPSVALGKNAADIALAVDAIEMLLTRPMDTFVILANDSDFTPLVCRIREEGRDVIGFGGSSAPDAFRRACTTFYEIRALTTSDAERLPAEKRWSRSPIEAETLILAALNDLGWTDQPVSVQALGERLARDTPQFDSRIYNRRTLSDLLRALPSVDLVEENGCRCVRPSIPES